MALSRDPTFDPALRRAVFTALSGDPGADPGADPTDVRGMLRAVGGASTRTRTGIDLTRAAAALGVSRRTVERWVRTAETGQGQRPSPGHAQTLRRVARQAATTRPGRRRALAAARASGAATQRGARMLISGMQGPQTRTYMRDRQTWADLTPDQVQAMLDAYETGGDKGLLGWVSGHWNDRGDGQPGYVEDWMFGQITGVDFQFFEGGGW